MPTIQDVQTSDVEEATRLPYEPATHDVQTNEEDAAARFPNAPATIQLLYHETIGSFNHLHKTLCVAGIRAIIEAICLDKKIEGKKEIKKRGCSGEKLRR